MAAVRTGKKEEKNIVYINNSITGSENEDNSKM